MRCEELAEVVYAYTNGELSSLENERIRTHLDECHICASRVKEQEILIGKFRDSFHVNINCPDFTDSVMAQLGQPGLSVVRRCAARWIWRIAACAAVVLIALFSMSLINRQGSDHIVTRPRAHVPALRTPHLPVKQQTVTADLPQPNAVPVPRSVSSSVKTRYHKRHDKHRRHPTKHLRDFSDQKKVALDNSDYALHKKSLPVICVSQVPDHHSGNITHITVTMVIADGITVSKSRQNITIPPPPNDGAEFVERPELKVISEPKIDAFSGS